MVLALLQGFFSGFSGFPSATKTNTSKLLFDLERVDDELPAENVFSAGNNHVVTKGGYQRSARKMLCFMGGSCLSVIFHRLISSNKQDKE